MDRICTSLVNAGHQVVLVGRLRKNSRPLPERPYRQHRITCRFDAGKAFYLEYNYKLVRELRHWKYDVVCSVDVDTLAAGAALTRGSQQLVFDAHEWFHMTPEVVNRSLIRGFWKGLARQLMPFTDLRYTVAPQLAKQLAQEYGYPFGTVRNLPQLAPAAAPYIPLEDQPKIILYQGMLNPGRGLETAIIAMDLLEDCVLWIAGSGPEEDQLQALAVTLKHPDRVKFLGFIPPDELPELTRRAWLGINLLANSSPSYYYSLANKALDYVQAGLPSVQMDFPEYRALADQYGCYLLLEDLVAPDLAKLIQAVADDEAAYNELQRACTEAAPELCWASEEQELLRLWSQLSPIKNDLT
ncbi:hypothetical protein A3850_013115 [Lewinella sp. 4G2]|nr:hypothetical protein A3850_013115 [Lewinella sp. 4G2]